MKRNHFLKSLIALPALSCISLESVKQFEKVYLKNVFVRGFAYYEGPKIIQDLNSCGQVALKREPENKFDSKAIAIYFNEHKIGYLPQESNKTLSILMDTDLLSFHAEITQIEPEASDWEKIRIAVYALKEIQNTEDLKKIEPYAALCTPHYYSLKSAENTITRFEFTENKTPNIDSNLEHNVPHVESDFTQKTKPKEWLQDKTEELIRPEETRQQDPDIQTVEAEHAYHTTGRNTDRSALQFVDLDFPACDKNLMVVYHLTDSLEELEAETAVHPYLHFNPDFGTNSDNEQLASHLALALEKNPLVLENEPTVLVNIEKLRNPNFFFASLQAAQGKSGTNYLHLQFSEKQDA